MLKFLNRIFGGSKKEASTSERQTIDIPQKSVRIVYGTIPSNKIQTNYSPTEDKTDIYTQEEYKKIISGFSILHDVIIRNGTVSSLAPVKEIKGTLGLSDCQIDNLSPLEIVHGDIWCSFHDRKSCLSSLGSLQKVNGNAGFRNTPLSDLGELQFVGGDLSLRDTQISDLGKLQYVGGNLSLPMRLKGKIDLSSVSVDGSVRYWNDTKSLASNASEEGIINVLAKSRIPIPYWPKTYIYPDHSMSMEPKEVQIFYHYFKKQFANGIVLDTEGNSNYYFMLLYDLQKQYRDPDTLSEKYDLLSKGYPKVKQYCDDILIELYNNSDQYEKAWNIVKRKEFVSLKLVNLYAEKIGDHIFDGEIAAKISGTGCLTAFGKKHIKEILPFFRSCLERFERKWGCRIYYVFYEKDKGYKSIDGRYSPEYYRQFYQLDEDSYNVYYSIGEDAYHKRRMDEILLVDHAVTEQLRVLLIESEDAYRESIGSPKIGEGWINETALFYKIKNYYKDYSVVQHGHPKWLGKQHLDVYFKDINLGVEYQGIQHYQPVDYFGGEEGFASNQERDERKRRLCFENGCSLVYVNEGYDFMDVIKDIDEAIRSK